MSPTDRPAKDIIEDDARLDQWFESYQRDMALRAHRRGQQQQQGIPLLDS